MPDSLRVYVFGAPGHIGGASTELWHTLRLWRRFGLECHVVPTWSMAEDFEPALAAIGVPVHRATEDTFDRVPGLAGATVVSFCNAEFLKAYGKLRRLGCSLVWANCMTWTFQQELYDFRAHGCPDAMLFQSQWQKGKLERQYADFGWKPERGHLIHGAFDVSDWPFAPTAHAEGTPFVLGKLARPDLDKWSSNLWPIYGRVQYRGRKALVMGLTPDAARKLGTLPDWANWLAPCALPTRDYLAKIHCLVPVNGGAGENWPRAGLECFASGVPVVAQREWGWTEMIEHGQTGYLGSTDEELAHWAAVLAHDEPLRLRMVANARERLVSELAHPETLWAQWERLFLSVSGAGAAAIPTPTEAGPNPHEQMAEHGVAA